MRDVSALIIRWNRQRIFSIFRDIDFDLNSEQISLVTLHVSTLMQFKPYLSQLRPALNQGLRPTPNI